MQIDTKTLKSRQIASSYLRISQNAQLLSHIQKFNPNRLNHRVLQFQSIDQREMLVLMVQTVYLLYSAYCCQTNIRMSKDIWIRHIDKEVFEIYRVYMVEQHFHAVGHKIQQYISKHYERIQWTSTHHFQAVIIHTLTFFLNRIQLYSQRYPQFIDKIYKNPFEEFRFVLTQLLIPNLKVIKQPKRLIQCLQKLEVFRDNSLLLNLSSSLLYEKIRPFIEQGVLFSQLREMQEDFKKELQKSLISMNRYKIICHFVETVIKYLVNLQIIGLNVSLDQNNKPRLNQPKEVQYFQKGVVESKPVYIQNLWQIHTKSQAFLLGKDNFLEYATCADSTAIQRKNKKDLGMGKANHYIIEVDKERQTISVKMLCSLGISNENIDNIIYQINTVSEDWFYPAFEFLDASNSPKGMENPYINKRLALKINFKLSPNKSTIARLLVVLDVLLVHQRAFLVQLTKPPYKRDLSLKYNLSVQTIERMNQLLLKNIERVYDIQMAEGDVEIQ